MPEQEAAQDRATTPCDQPPSEQADPSDTQRPFTWTAGPKLGPRLVAYAASVGRSPAGLISEWVRARLGNARRGGLSSKLTLAGAPPDLGDRLQAAAVRDGCDSVSEWAIRTLEAALVARADDLRQP